MRSCLFVLALASAALLYAVSTPVGGSPDEDAHMIYAWGVMSGQGFGEGDVPCDDSGNPCPAWSVDVPSDFAPDNRCYIAKVQVEAACGGQLSDTVRPTSAFQYPPPYYVVTGTAFRIADGLGASGQTLGFAGRLASIALAMTLLVPALRYATGPVLAATQVSLTPMAFFMIGSINPSGIEIAAAIAAAVAIVRIADDQRSAPPAADLEERERGSRGPVILLAVSLAWLAWARPLGPVWAALLASAAVGYLSPSLRPRALVATLTSRPALWISAAVSIGGASVWLLATLGTHTAGSVNSRVTLPEPGAETVAAVVLRWGGLVWENLGLLGWLDTRPPLLVMLASWAAIVIVASERFGHHMPNRPRRVVLGAFCASAIVLVTASMWLQEFLWQGRYVLPLLAAALVLLSGSAAPAQFVSTTLATQLWALCTVATAVWLYARHAFGLQPGVRHFVPDLSGGAQWWGPLGLIGYLCLAALSAGLLLSIAARSSRLRPGIDDEG